jgi:tRNA(Ile)-lysidine synthase
MKNIGFAAPHKLAGCNQELPILAAFSGGADSSAMLYMLKDYCDKVGCALYAAHINHCIRGAEADADEAFCRRTAEKLGIKIFVLRADVPAIAKERKKSVETAAREIRYEFFDKVMEENSIPILALAHNADDNLETILFNIARGSGLSGVSGIPLTRRVKGGLIVRPILTVNKSEILEYCAERGIEYVTDSTNADIEYSRNRIRNRVIPELKAICSEAERSAARLSESLREDAACLESMAACFLLRERKGSSVPLDKLCSEPYAIASRAVISLYGEISEGEDLEYVHIKAVLELAERGVPHSSLDLPGGVRAVIENKSLAFTKEKKAKSENAEAYSVELSEGINFISQINAEIIIGNTDSDKNVYKKSIKFLIDSDKIIGTLRVRSREPMDKIRVLGCSKSIKKLVNEKKIDTDIRSKLPIICDDAGIVAVPLVAVADRCYTKDGKNCTSPLSIRFNLL